MSANNTAEKVEEVCVDSSAEDTDAGVQESLSIICSFSLRKEWKSISIILLSVLFVATFFIPSISLPKIFEVSEGREGVVVKAMVEQGNLVLPLRHNLLVPSKPPLFHWLSLGLWGKLWGNGEALSEFWLRLPSVIAALLLLAVTAAVASTASGPLGAFICAMVLGTTSEFVGMGSDGRVDMLFSALISSSIMVLMTRLLVIPSNGTRDAFDSRSLNLRLVTMLAGLAVLAKGPAGPILIVATICAMLLLEEGFRGLKILLSWNWLWTIALPLPWYIAAHVTNQNTSTAQENIVNAPSFATSFLDRSLIFENWQRLVGGEGITSKPWYFYLVNFIPSTAPWGLLLVFFLFALPLSLSSVSDFLLKDVWARMTEREKKLFRLSLIWIGVVITMLSFAVGKRTAYLLTIAPPMCLALSVLLANCIQAGWFVEKFKMMSSSRADFLSFCGVSAMTATAALPFLCLMVSNYGFTENFISGILINHPHFYYRVMNSSSAFERGWPFLVLSTLVTVTTSFIFLKIALRFRSLFLLFISAIMSLFLVHYVTLTFFNQISGETKSYAPIAQILDAEANGEPITFVKKPLDESLDGLFFYLKSTSLLADISATPIYPGLYVARNNWWESQEETWKYGIRKVWQGGRTIDSPEDQLVMFRMGKQPSSKQPDNTKTDESNHSPNTLPSTEVNPSRNVGSLTVLPKP